VRAKMRQMPQPRKAGHFGSAPAKAGEVSWMRVPYGEDLASHTGPESCVGTREGGGEALTGVRAGWPLSPERSTSGMPRRFSNAEGHTNTPQKAKGVRVPRGRRPHARTQAPRKRGQPSRPEAGSSPTRPEPCYSGPRHKPTRAR